MASGVSEVQNVQWKRHWRYLSFGLPLRAATAANAWISVFTLLYSFFVGAFGRSDGLLSGPVFEFFSLRSIGGFGAGHFFK
tara:strand:- start:1533 stop:1775 length:243 start_codon:yes stop_codon:yes gene_type:complete